MYFLRAIAFGATHGIVRTLVYAPCYRCKEGKKERPYLYTEIGSRMVVNAILNVYLSPYTVLKDCENVERSLRGMSLTDPMLLANSMSKDIFHGA